jgi:hypothetical protein
VLERFITIADVRTPSSTTAIIVSADAFVTLGAGVVIRGAGK